MRLPTFATLFFPSALLACSSSVALHGSAEVQIRLPPPPPPAPAVALQSETVVEFFGVPLEGAQDVIFVLDVSGSMNDRAAGAIAALVPPKLPPPAVPETVETIETVEPGETDDPKLLRDPANDPTADPASDPTGAPPVAGATDAYSPQDTAGQGTAGQGTAGQGTAGQDTAGQDTVQGPSAPSPSAEPPLEPALMARPSKVDVARFELIAALERLPAGTRMNVLFFHDGVEGFAEQLVSLQDNDRAGFIDFVERVRASGSTALAPALRTAFLLNARRVVLLSDGLGNVGGESPEILRDAREAMRSGVRIDTIGIGPDHDRSLMRTLASESGGLYQAL